MVSTKNLMIRTFLRNAYFRVKLWWHLDLVGAAANATYKVFDVDISQTIVKCLFLFPVVFSSIINLHPLSFGIRRNHVRRLSSPVIFDRIYYETGSFVLETFLVIFNFWALSFFSLGGNSKKFRRFAARLIFSLKLNLFADCSRIPLVVTAEKISETYTSEHCFSLSLNYNKLYLQRWLIFLCWQLSRAWAGSEHQKGINVPPGLILFLFISRLWFDNGSDDSELFTNFSFLFHEHKKGHKKWN